MEINTDDLVGALDVLLSSGTVSDDDATLLDEVSMTLQNLEADLLDARAEVSALKAEAKIRRREFAILLDTYHRSRDYY